MRSRSGLLVAHKVRHLKTCKLKYDENNSGIAGPYSHFKVGFKKVNVYVELSTGAEHVGQDRCHVSTKIILWE